LIFLYVLDGRLAFDLIDNIRWILRRVALESMFVDKAKVAAVLFDLFMSNGRRVFDPIPEDDYVAAEFVRSFAFFAAAEPRLYPALATSRSTARGDSAFAAFRSRTHGREREEESAGAERDKDGKVGCP
jgi:hypothetical protein